MHLKKVNQNTSKLFCALFMLGMNVYGVDRQGNDYDQIDTMMYDGQRNTLSQSAINTSNEYFDTKNNEGDFFDSLLNLALDGNDDARRSIERLTSKDSQINPTTKMWYDACNKTIHATMQGNCYGLEIFQYLTSDACYTKPETLDSNFLEYIMKGTVDIGRREKHKTEKSFAHVFSFAILTYLMSPDCQVRPSQEVVYELFREKVDSVLVEALDGSDAAMDVIKILTSNDCQTDPTIIERTISRWYGACRKAIDATMQGNSYGLEIFQYLTSDACHIKSKTLGSNFLKCIMDSTAKIAQIEQNEKVKSSAHDRSFAILTYLMSPDCKVRPSQEAVDQLFRENVDSALDGSDAAMDVIKILTSKDCQTDPTIINQTLSMWYDACRKAIDATMQGNKRGLKIFQYLISEECHTKLKTAGSDFLQLIMDSKKNIEKNEQSKKVKSPAYYCSFAILTHLTSQDCQVRPSQEAVDQLFREKVDLALVEALDGSYAAMETIKILTRKDSNTQPTLTMWDKACDTAIHATLEGNSYGLDIFKYLTSDACHHKREKLVPALFSLILNFTAACAEREQSNPVQTFESKIPPKIKEYKEYKDRSFAILTYLTSQDCKVPPSQEVVDQLFREKVKQYLEMKNGSFGPTCVINYLTSDYCSVRPSQKEVDSFFGQLIDAYTEMKSFGIYAPEDTSSPFFNAITHLISNKCNRHPSPQIVHNSINTLTQADSKRRSELTSNLVPLNGNNNTDLGEIEEYGMHLQNTELRDLKERFEEYLKDLPEAVGNISEVESKTVNKSEEVDIVSNSQLKNNNRDPQEQFTMEF